MAGAAPAAPEKSDPPIHNLLPSKNGLDNGVHFSDRQWTTVKSGQGASFYPLVVHSDGLCPPGVLQSVTLTVTGTVSPTTQTPPLNSSMAINIHSINGGTGCVVYDYTYNPCGNNIVYQPTPPGWSGNFPASAPANSGPTINGQNGGSATLTVTVPVDPVLNNRLRQHDWWDTIVSVSFGTECYYGRIDCGGGSRTFTITSATLTMNLVPTQCSAELLSGNNQRGAIGQPLDPVRVRLLKNGPYPGGNSPLLFSAWVDIPDGQQLPLRNELDSAGAFQDIFFFTPTAASAGQSTYTIHQVCTTTRRNANPLPVANRVIENTVIVTVNPNPCSISSVSFTQLNGGAELSPNPQSQGGGLRMFAEKAMPNGPVLENVKVVIKANPNQRLNIASYDVDDPSPDTVVDPNGSAGNDNLGTTSHGLSSGVVDTNGNGDVVATFQVTHQPGDNFMVVAACPQDALPSSPDNVPGLPSSGSVARTEMLTVWRTLNVELDVMGPVSGNLIRASAMRISNLPETVLYPARTLITLNRTIASAEAARFLPSTSPKQDIAGRVLINSRYYTITSIARSVVTVLGTVPPELVGQDVKLFDDDDFNGDDGQAKDGDDGESFTIPTDILANLEAALAPAMIAARPAPNPRPIAPFLLNAPAVEPLDWVPALGTYDTQAIRSDEYWVGYVLFAYQFVESKDRDPQSELGGVRGTTQSINGQASVVFLESHAEVGDTLRTTGDYSGSVLHTVAHEVGHQLGLCHVHGGLMTDLPTPVSQGGARLSLRAIRKVREYSPNGGGFIPCPLF